MAWLCAALGLVGLVQSVVWVGTQGPRQRLGTLMAPVALLFFALGIVWGLVPDFFSDTVGFDGR